MKIDKKYLPSEQFVARVIILIIIIVIVLGMYNLVKFIKNKVTNRKGGQIELQIGDLIQKDTNKNGIADWEESLWGLDPNKNGKSNREIIMGKKQALSPKDIANNSEQASDNELLAREFFAVIMALQQTGDLNTESMQSISGIVSEKIEAPLIPDIYKREMITIRPSSDVNLKAYYESVKGLILKYEDKDIGKELSIIAQGLEKQDPQALYVAKMVAQSYRNFGQELVKIPTPENIIDIHLNLANDYEKTAQSIEGLSEMLSDPILGMRSIVNYKKYTDLIVSDMDKLSKSLR